jgi:LuxR family transcriptional regulator
MNWREDCLHRLARSSQSSQEIVAELASIVRGLGFEYCSYVLRLPFPLSKPAVLWSSTYPEHWLEHYFSHNYLDIDPLLQRIARNPAPVAWSDDTFKNEPAFWEEARAHGVRHGWAVATHGSASTTGMLSLARSHDALSDSELWNCEAQLVWLSQAVHGLISNLEMKKFQLGLDQELSHREREVLRWTSAGKTAGEIGIILGISERTVNFHITSTLVKLNSVNKTQAVMIAAMLGLLF